MSRKCIYTGKDAKSKDSVIPRQRLSSDEHHNWSNNAPVNSTYQSVKGDRLPTELEMQANEVFHLLELARLRVAYYEQKAAEIQAEILKDYKEPEIKPNKPTVREKKKEQQVEQMLVEKHVVDAANALSDKFFEAMKETPVVNKPKKMWEDG